ncbi:histone family DNA-binding [Dickeya phage vB-DsoM-LIMEstone1]|uniref:Histone-like protein n=4 Tax=Aglimvirinae TaxID=2169530 RepID=I0J2N2_9CAUD|nr:histone family DNA-binding [Dickeya phage vB-DsoM-LIMEstone1]YP_009103010.1 histone family DNA-binding [Dickeya phage RC-2014]AIM51668.1 putative histone-like protein [Dickeya phage phiDP10.3]AYN55586.1 hypothetical protein [Dickeya phage Kamild]AHZ60185.1 putative histone-like protein [Dickeya phage RC-2014]CCD57569.1 hypothetical protein [Dickeya phage vB-DsoM-LIMEstone1]
MQSMIKRKVEVSLNAHVDIIQQLVLDAYEIQKDRISRGVIDPTCPGNILYYRMIRQTGHTAALKKILSYDFQTENNLNIMGVFHSVRERDSFFHSRAGADVPSPDVDKKQHTTTTSHFMGTGIDKANIIVFSDTLHDPKRLAAAHEMLRNSRSALTNLTLVVFLG